MEQSISINYADVVRQIKNAILQSRYRAAKLANREMLSLYFGIGKFISENSRDHFWGTGAIESISERLQQELPGLRGFSPANIKRMRQFYEEWQPYLITENHIQSIRPMLSDEIQIDLLAANRPTVSDDLEMDTWNSFLSIGFSHHYEIIIKTKTLEERFFYIGKCATEFWNYRVLQNNLKSNLFAKQGKLPNNFAITISDTELRRKALLSFKDEYLLDYINIESPDDEPDERVLESEIVLNIKNFIMSLGKDFAFIGNQHRFIVEEREYFVDLLFFNRQLQCLVAIDLKRGEFKPEYLGKMNFYLSALDDLVRLPHENRSIGIILCKSKKEKIVEYAFRDTSKPMGVATYKLATELPEKYRDVLPDAEELRRLM
ncbi:PDDEXK nuclease domain-containing protein [Petrimonas sp.]|uniref:PDDEXK nuclease domain-containing protein n=1 Tax=Petrimonas sp. TaxID=2023866 RepID=UPI003F5176AC